MYCDPNQFPDRVIRGDDGVYRNREYAELYAKNPVQ